MTKYSQFTPDPRQGVKWVQLLLLIYVQSGLLFNNSQTHGYFVFFVVVSLWFWRICTHMRSSHIETTQIQMNQKWCWRWNWFSRSMSTNRLARSTFFWYFVQGKEKSMRFFCHNNYTRHSVTITMILNSGKSTFAAIKADTKTITNEWSPSVRWFTYQILTIKFDLFQQTVRNTIYWIPFECEWFPYIT